LEPGAHQVKAAQARAEFYGDSSTFDDADKWISYFKLDTLEGAK
jgi:hypothetical protein